MTIAPRERYAHPQSNEYAKQLYDIGVSNGIKTAKECVKHSDTC